MYLARLHSKGKTCYVIRQSYPDQGHFKSRDLFNLGADPTRFIHYPGGNSYYYDPLVEDALLEQGVELSSDDLDQIFHDFLQPEIQRVIAAFDRGFRNRSCHPDTSGFQNPSPIHLFDKRRYHYLRFGHSSQRHIGKVEAKVFKILQYKSRDELEHYFEGEERRLPPNALGAYVNTIFQLSAFRPQADTGQALQLQLDHYFLDRLCRLNSDKQYLAGALPPKALFPHLIRYAVYWFDFESARHIPQWRYIRDFINRHRIYRPPPKTAIKIKMVEKLFGYDWKTLNGMDGPSLTRIYRRLALKHHPDQGGDTETFQRLTQYYKVLIQKKPKG